MSLPASFAHFIPAKEANGNRKLSQDDVDDIRASLEAGASVKQMVEKYKVSTTTINCIKRNKLWKEQDE